MEPSKVGRRGSKGTSGILTLAVSETSSSKEEEEWLGALSPAGCMAAAEMPEADSAGCSEWESECGAESARRS